MPAILVQNSPPRRQDAKAPGECAPRWYGDHREYLRAFGAPFILLHALHGSAVSLLPWRLGVLAVPRRIDRKSADRAERGAARAVRALRFGRQHRARSRADACTRQIHRHHRVDRRYLHVRARARLALRMDLASAGELPGNFGLGHRRHRRRRNHEAPLRALQEFKASRSSIRISTPGPGRRCGVSSASCPFRKSPSTPICWYSGIGARTGSATAITRSAVSASITAICATAANGSVPSHRIASC